MTSSSPSKIQAAASSAHIDRRAEISHPDGVPIQIEVRHGLQAVRDLRSLLLELAARIHAASTTRLILLLEDSRISRERLAEEVAAARRVLAPEVSNRLAVAVVEGGHIDSLATGGEFGWFEPELVARLQGLNQTRPIPDTRPHSHFAITKILVGRWLRRLEPISRAELAAAAGYSIPTIAKSVSGLSGYLVPGRADRVGLAEFPDKAWADLVSRTDEARKTTYLGDVSGQPRTWSYLQSRISEALGDRVAVGGVLAARFWDPRFDLSGMPRLDISTRSAHGEMPIDEILRVDPGLVPVDRGSSAIRIAVHGVFEHDWSVAWDDQRHISVVNPVECLLDLLEMRLESQAEALIERLRRGERP